MPSIQYSVTLAVALPALLIPALLLLGRKAGPSIGYLAMGALLISCTLLASLATALPIGSTAVEEWQWMPALGVNVTFLADGLSLFYGLIICGIGSLVCWYAVSYLHHDLAGQSRFYSSLLLFATAMLGTVFAENALLLFVFWECTGVASFLLIGFFNTQRESREGARRALLTTAATGLCLLVGIIMLGSAAGTYSFSSMPAAAELPAGSSTWLDLSLFFIAIGIFGKSAQFPFHFWLPGAMAAPTPVSVYLHSATMVKLGVYLTARIFPIYSEAGLWLPLLAGVCFFTMLFGAWLALRSNDLKAILAYTTVSQLGMLIGYYGIGPAIGVRFDYLFILTHVFYKAALFMVAGIVDHATGTRDVRRLGGLLRAMPGVGVSAAISCAALAGLPLTAGFLSKEALLSQLVVARVDHPWSVSLVIGAVVLSAIFSVAIALRVFFKVFAGRAPAEMEFHHPGARIAAPVYLLSLGTLLLGTFPGLFQSTLDRFRLAGLHFAEPSALKLWHGFNLELALSAIALLAGWALYRQAEKQEWRRASIPRLLQFDSFFDRALDRLTHEAGRLTLALRADWPPAYLPITIAFLLLVAAWLAATSDWSLLRLGEDPRWSLHPLRTGLVLLITAALIGVLFLPRWSAQLVALSVAGFFITLYFVVSRAPDLAMTQLLVESASVIMILFLLSRFPSSSQMGIRFEWTWRMKHVTRLGLSLGMGLLMASLVLFVEPHRHPDPAGLAYLQLSESAAEGSNAVNTILVDFRGFDTLGEITVVLIAALGSLGLMMRYRSRRSDPAPAPGFMLGERRTDEKS